MTNNNKVAKARKLRSPNAASASGNVRGNFMATHNGGGYWTVFNQLTGDRIVNIIPQVQSDQPNGFDGDLGVLGDVPLVTTANVDDLITVIRRAKDSIVMGGWEAPTE